MNTFMKITRLVRNLKSKKLMVGTYSVLAMSC